MKRVDPGVSRTPEIGAPPADGVKRPSGLLGTLLRIPTLKSLHFREFRLLWLGQGCNSMGMWMDQIARGWLMYELTDSTVQLGFITALRAGPMLLLSLEVLRALLGDQDNVLSNWWTNNVLQESRHGNQVAIIKTDGAGVHRSRSQ